VTGIAASIKIVKLPNLPPKGDVSDWFNSGGTMAELRAIAAATPAIGGKAISQSGAESLGTNPGPSDSAQLFLGI
jgi:hypothetical protein